jgi:hypothetical protein
VLTAIQKHVTYVSTQLRLLTAVSCSIGNELIWRPTSCAGASNNMASATCTMNDTDKPKIEELAQEVAFWNRYREARRIEGIDIAQLYADLAAAQKQALTSPGAREDFTELCNNGCFQITLAAVVVLLRYSPQLENYWPELVGRPDNREKSARNLELAVHTLEDLFGSIVSAEIAGKNAELVQIGRLPVSRVISELRLHIRKRGKRNPVWELQWWEDYIKEDGKIGRRRQSVTLGAVAEITLRQARKLGDEQVRPINQGIQVPQSTMKFWDFVERYLVALFFPTLKASTQKRYRQTLTLHLLPAFGKSRLCDIGTIDLQRFVLQKMESSLSWESANHFRNLMSKAFEMARMWGSTARAIPRAVFHSPKNGRFAKNKRSSRIKFCTC